MATNQDGSVPEIIEIVSQAGGSSAQQSLVVAGPETEMLVEHLGLPDESKATLLQEAQRILARGPHAAPSDDETAANETGLVIGYVQSGKTMSFTTVTALARDNNYRMVIVIAGTSVPLLNQSEGRLDKDLQLDTRSDRKWLPFKNPSPSGTEGNAIRDTLDEWKDPTLPEAERQTVLITVMKNARHLQNLVDVLKTLDLHNVPTLIVDDEADQAGLNTRVKQGEESAIYQRLLSLRATTPDHLYLQYTATPQAPLLISLIDTLSPDFAELLTPGPDYTGGKDFFYPGSHLVRTIDDDEIPAKGHRLPEPPPSLLEAMRIFFLSVAAGLVLDGGKKGNRSMMVHPSQETMRHAEYKHWVTQAKEQWQGTLALPIGHLDRRDLLADFEAAYRDLQATVPNLPSFDVLVGRLLHAIRKTRIEEINATRGKTPDIDWKVAYPWILVGGQAMDRGFTVEGLTVTYMPRSVGTGNADTIQQRARFFGYKRGYLGYCRVYLDIAARDAYEHYIVHEEDIREQLIAFRDTGKPLADWKREFFLDRKLKPTRANVLKLGYMRGKFNEQWHTQNVPQEPNEAVEANRNVVRDFLSKLTLVDDSGHLGRTPTQKHKVATDVPLRQAYEELLTPLRTPNLTDSQLFTRLRLQIDAYLSEHPGATCTIYYMGGGTARVRSLTDDGEVENVFQGAYPTDKTQEQIYPGDRAIKAEQGVTIQIRNLDIRNRPEFKNIPAIAVWIPKEMSGYDVLVQDQGSHP